MEISNKAINTRRVRPKFAADEVLVRQCQSQIGAIRQVQVLEQSIIVDASSTAAWGWNELKELKRLQKENERLRRAFFRSNNR